MFLRNKNNNVDTLKMFNAFDQWMQRNRDFSKADAEHLLDWMLIACPKSTHHHYLSMVKQAAENGYKTAIDLPLSEDEFNHRGLLAEFSAWNERNQSTCVDAESLLNWLDNQYFDNDFTYNKFLTLTQVAAKQGFVTAIDVPISKEDFHFRKLVNHFDAWMKGSERKSDKTDTENLLEWLEKRQCKSNPRIRHYRDFLALTHAVAKRGYATTIDIPVTEEEFNKHFVIQKFFFAVENIKTSYSLCSHVNPKRAAFIKLLDRLADAEFPGLSTKQIEKALYGLIIYMQESIRNEYSFSFLNTNNSLLYSLTKSAFNLPDRSDNVSSYLEACKRLIRAAPNDIVADLTWKNKENLLEDINSQINKERDKDVIKSYLIMGRDV